MEDGDIRHRETPARGARIRDARKGRLYMSYASI